MNDTTPQRKEKLWIAILSTIGSLLLICWTFVLIVMVIWGGPIFEKIFGDLRWWNMRIVEEWVVLYLVCLPLSFFILWVLSEIVWRLSKDRSTTESTDQDIE